MGKYKVEVTYTITYTKTFEVEATSNSEAIDKAEQEAYNFDFHLASGSSKCEGEVMESPEDRGECPECGTTLIEDGPNRKECPNCGNFF